MNINITDGEFSIQNTTIPDLMYVAAKLLRLTIRFNDEADDDDTEKVIAYIIKTAIPPHIDLMDVIDEYNDLDLGGEDIFEREEANLLHIIRS